MGSRNRKFLGMIMYLILDVYSNKQKLSHKTSGRIDLAKPRGDSQITRHANKKSVSYN